VPRFSRIATTSEPLIVKGRGAFWSKPGTALLERLIQLGRDEKIDRITADVLPENIDMQRVCDKVGFQLTHSAGDPVMKALFDF
jgi:RimJ/RimL family protein N-acetyltransferase